MCLGCRPGVTDPLPQQARKFLEWQAQDWASLSGAVADWLSELAHLLEDYHAKTGTNEGDVRGALKVRHGVWQHESWDGSTPESAGTDGRQ